MNSLNPGKIDFIDPSIIVDPRITRLNWIEKGSLEDFWQNNKLLVGAVDDKVISDIQVKANAILKSNHKENWKILGELTEFLFAIGGMIPDLAKSFSIFEKQKIKRTC